MTIGALLAGCGGGSGPIQETHLAGWGAYPAEPFIQVLQAPPEGPYVPIARLAVNGTAGLDRAQALAALEQRARALGANAIVVTQENQPVPVGLSFNPAGGSYSMTASQSGATLVGEAIHMGVSGTQQYPGG